MKKVCILTTAHPRYDTRVFFREARSLAERYDTTLLVADGKPAEVTDGVKIRSVVDRLPKNRPERMFRFTGIMYRAAMQEQADVYHFHDTELFPIALKLKRRGKTVVYDAHESIPDTVMDRDYLPRWMLKIVSRMMYYFERYTARRMDAVITVVPLLRDKFLGWGCDTHMLCNFPVLGDFSEGTTPWQERENCACYAGAQIDRSRGVYEMAEAAQLSGIPLELYGRIPKEVGRDISSIDRKGLVTMHGRVPHKELREKLTHSRIGMVTQYPSPNSNMAYAIKMFEYMAAGMVIITANIPLWEQIVTESGCGLSVDPKNPGKIAEAMCYLTEHPAEAEQMALAGRKAALERYNWGSQRHALFSLYEKLTGEARA